MGPLTESRATLRIFGVDLDPEEVTSLIGAEPSSSKRRGEPVGRSATTRPSPRGHWKLAAAIARPANLDKQVQELLGQLTDDLKVWGVLATRFEMNLFCGLFMASPNEGLTVSPITLAALGARGVELQLDLYASDDDA